VDVLVVSPGFVATDIRQRALEPTGNRWGKVPVMRAKAMEECVHQIVWAMERRKREHIMTLKGDTLGKADSAGTG